jgi:uncharacterized protein
MKTRRVILAGGSGFLGEILTEHFLRQNCDVVVLTRGPHNTKDATRARKCFWDGRTLGDWIRELEGADVLINLAGRSVDCRYHARNRKLMMDSRINSTRVLGEAVVRSATPPKVWLNSSTATIYRHTYGPAWDEKGEIGATPEAQDAFSIDIATAWEREFDASPTPCTRKVALRTAMVFGHGENSVFPVLRRLVRLGLGGRMASGRQFVSWIHQADFCRAIDWILVHESITGPVNLAAPNPVPNAEMMFTLRKLCGVPFGLPAAAWMLEVGAFILRTEPELIVKSRRVVPGRLLASGFKFHFPEIRTAMMELLARTTA